MKSLTRMTVFLLLLALPGLSSCPAKSELIPDPEGKASCERKLEQLNQENCTCVYKDGWVISCGGR